MSDEPKALMICGRAENQPLPSDAVVITADCGHQVIAGPSTQHALENRGEVQLITTCVPCLFTDYEKYRAYRKAVQMHGHQLLPGALYEVNEQLGPEVADAVQKVFKTYQNDEERDA